MYGYFNRHPYFYLRAVRKISADYVFPVASPPVKNGLVIADDSGTILDLTHYKGEKDTEKYTGVIVPGFVNAHCHLELSYLKNKIPNGQGLDKFLRDVEAVRKKFSLKKIKSALRVAEKEMLRNGIVAAGDISNSSASFSQKAKKRLQYHTFIEVLGFHPERAERAFEQGKQLLKQCRQFNLSCSIVPHSPYSASEKLLDKINELARKQKAILSFHNQESKDENLLFRNKSGKILQRLEGWGIDTSFFQPVKSNSLQFILPKLNGARKILLVHNTFTKEKDFRWLKRQKKKNNPEIYFCLCPNANLYIESRLPDITLFVREKVRITMGTDSLASNRSLSILEEMKTISEFFPRISFEEILSWATCNGAAFLGFEKKLGTIEKGKRPGLNLLQGFDLKKMKLLEKTSVKKII